MKKHLLISVTLLVASAGCTTCGQGWRPNIFSRMYHAIHGHPNVGAPCDAGCQAAHAEPSCPTCGETAYYGGTEGTVIGSYETPAIGTGISALPSGSYVAPSTPGIINREQVPRKPAN